jgi:hypothetical protein
MSISRTIRDRCVQSFNAEFAVALRDVPAPISDKLVWKTTTALKHNFFLSYPFLFSTHYPTVAEEDVYALALCGSLYFSYMLFLDKIIDHQSTEELGVIPHLLQQRAMRRICTLFPEDSPFWIHFDNQTKAFTSGFFFESGILTSEEGRQDIENNFLHVARAKNAIAKAYTGGLLALSKSGSPEDPFELTQEHFFAGLQLLDDFEDWKEDFLNERRSYLLSLVFQDKDFCNTLNNAGNEKVELLGRYIHYSNASTELLEKALASLDASLESCRLYNVPNWRELVDFHLRKGAKIQQDYHRRRNWVMENRKMREAIRAGEVQSITNLTEKTGKKPLTSCIARALSFLLLAQQHDYAEMNHLMVLPTLERMPDGSREILVFGNVFQRTIVLDTLLDASDWLAGSVPRQVLDTEVTRIIDARLPSVRGGWNYCPECTWLPPDPDDLAQVVQILTRVGYKDKELLLDDPIDLLINENRFANGMFRTWILDPSDRGEDQASLTISVDSLWGERAGQNIDVTANMLYALCLYNPAKYESTISQGIQAVVRAQEPSGMWESEWYWDVFYGTYVATRLLTHRRTNLEILAGTKEYVKSTQRDDGGWGSEVSDPLNSALALLSLVPMDAQGGEDPSINSAVTYLLSTQRSDGSWLKVPFIKMRTGNVYRTYQSRTITTSYALKALLAALGRQRTGSVLSEKGDYSDARIEASTQD